MQVNNAVAPRGGDVIETIGSAWVLCGVETTHLQLVQLVPTLEQLKPEQNELLAVMPDDEL